MNPRTAARAATLALLLVCLGGSLSPAAQATATHRGPVNMHTMQHGMCHMAGDGESHV